MHFGGSCPLTEFCQLQMSLSVQVFRSPKLAALLHDTPVLGFSQTLRRWAEGATYICQGGHHVGHRPTFHLFSCGLSTCFTRIWLNKRMRKLNSQQARECAMFGLLVPSHSSDLYLYLTPFWNRFVCYFAAICICSTCICMAWHVLWPDVRPSDSHTCISAESTIKQSVPDGRLRTMFLTQRSFFNDDDKDTMGRWKICDFR